MSAKLLQAIAAILAETRDRTWHNRDARVSAAALDALRDACAMGAERREFWRYVLTTCAESSAITYWVGDSNIRRAAPSEGFSVGLVDWIEIREDETGARFELTPETLEIGALRLFSPAFRIGSQLRGSILGAIASLDAGDIDSEAADCLAQAACFGRLVYG